MSIRRVFPFAPMTMQTAWLHALPSLQHVQHAGKQLRVLFIVHIHICCRMAWSLNVAIFVHSPAGMVS